METIDSKTVLPQAFVIRALVIILATAVLVRVFVAIMLGDSANPISGAYDQVSYDLLAQRVLQGHGFTFPVAWYPFTLPNEPTSHWSFLYTVFLAGVYGLFGHHPLAARLVQVILSTAICWLIFRIGRRLFGEWAGLAAAALAALYAYLVFFNAALMTQTFYIICLLITLDIAMGIVDAGQHGYEARQAYLPRWMALGAALGFGALFRQTLLLFAPLLFAWLWWADRSARVGRSPSAAEPLTKPPLSPLAGFLVAASMIVALILPWTVRNYFAYHDFLLLNSNSGFWFYSSNHPNQGTDFNPSYVAPIPESLRGLPEPAIDRALLRQGLGFIVQDPIRFALLTLNRTKDYFWLFPSDESSALSNLGRVFSFTLYLPFMLYGLVLSLRRWRSCVPLYLYVLFDTFLCLISWSAPRYRLPSDAIMMVFAGLAVIDLVERFGLLSRLRRHVRIEILR